MKIGKDPETGKDEKKVPYVKWKKYQTELPSEGDLRYWFGKKWPDANIAIVCGGVSGIFAIDLDSTEALEHYKAVYDADVEDTICQTTGRDGGGLHALLNTMGQKIPLVQPILEKTDLKGDGSYIVVEPSIHETGRLYKWGHLNPLTDGIDDILDPPSGFFKMLQDHEKRKAEKEKGTAPSNTKKESKNPEGWEQAILMGVSEGERDVAAAKLAGLYLSKDYAQGDTIVLLKRWNERNVPPLPEKDIEKCVKSIYRDHHKKNANGIANVIEKIIILRYPDGSNKYKLCLGNDKYALVTMDALMSSRRTVVAIADTTRLIFFPPKQEKWLALLKIWLSAAEEQVISIEESELGIIKEIISEWLIKWEGQKDSKHIDHATMLKNHCVVKDGIIYFTLPHLEEDLRFRNSKMTRTMLCEFLRRLGSKITEPRLRFSGKRTRTWEIAEFSCE
jgi:hypothetical protein